MRMVFYHNPHDRASHRTLELCRAAGLTFEVVDAFAADKPAVFRAYPCLAVLSDTGELIAAFEQENLVPAVIATMVFEEPEGPKEPPPDGALCETIEAIQAARTLAQLKTALVAYLMRPGAAKGRLP